MKETHTYCITLAAEPIGEISLEMKLADHLFGLVEYIELDSQLIILPHIGIKSRDILQALVTAELKVNGDQAQIAELITELTSDESDFLNKFADFMTDDKE